MFFFFFLFWCGDANTFPYSKSTILRWFLSKDSRCPELIPGSCSCWNPSLTVFFPPVLKLLLHYPAGDNCQKLEMKESYISFFSLHNSYSVLPIQNITKGIVESVCVCVCVCVCVTGSFI